MRSCIRMPSGQCLEAHANAISRWHWVLGPSVWLLLYNAFLFLRVSSIYHLFLQVSYKLADYSRLYVQCSLNFITSSQASTYCIPRFAVNKITIHHHFTLFRNCICTPNSWRNMTCRLVEAETVTTWLFCCTRKWRLLAWATSAALAPYSPSQIRSLIV